MAHRLQQPIVRGAHEAEALPEEQRSQPFLHRVRKLKFIVVEDAGAWQENEVLQKVLHSERRIRARL